jgi:glycerol-3-phosphate dehydrogenase subunit C
MEFLDGLRKEKRLSREFARGYGKIAYHAACHLRAQKIAIPGARVLSQLPDTEVRILERCSAVDGTWGMKAAFYEEGRRYAKRLTDDVRAGQEDGETAVVTDCSLAALRMLKENGVQARHPVELLADAYGDA